MASIEAELTEESDEDDEDGWRGFRHGGGRQAVYLGSAIRTEVVNSGVSKVSLLLSICRIMDGSG